MTDIEVVQIISAVSGVVTPALAVIGFIELHRKNNAIQSSVDIVRHETNSMKDELVAEVREASLAKGRLDKETEMKLASVP